MSHRGTPISHLSTFTCIRCGLDVSSATPDADPRTHCPNCLAGRHGSTAERRCGARTHPIAIAVLRDGDWMLIHRCTGCETLSANPVVGDDNQLLLVRIAVKPLAQPPFPLEHLAQL
ncbi:RNHCP domain-containing protein [Prescottella defluvii]|uniref:RNHCP domain-containing protein n=1 Tax=Prescottella defluvii TaxID=1323361 RepID=UPI0004F29BA6|nr:RNHCP domain-containing protein [Prescottella defluvii]